MEKKTETGLFVVGSRKLNETIKYVAKQDMAEGSRNSLVPTGTLLAFAASTPPAGFILCDGSSYRIEDYEDLFDVIGFTYGGSGNTFYVPNLKGRTVLGAGAGAQQGGAGTGIITGGTALTTRSNGQFGGDERLHAHNHGISDPGHQHSAIATAGGGGGWPVATWTVGGAYAGNNTTFGWTGGSYTGIGINNAGAGASQNMHPFTVATYIIKY